MGIEIKLNPTTTKKIVQDVDKDFYDKHLKGVRGVGNDRWVKYDKYEEYVNKIKKELFIYVNKIIIIEIINLFK